MGLRSLMATPPQRQRLRLAHPAQAPRGQAWRPQRSAGRNVPCPWCRQPLPPACCAGCLNQVVRQAGRADANAAIEASQQALAVALAQSSRRRLLLDRRSMLLSRTAELRAMAERRAAALHAQRKRLEESSQEFRERRRHHETRAAQWVAFRRQLEMKRCRISREEFLQNPSQHSAVLGAFHVYQELYVVTNSLQKERRRRCAEAASIFPLKRIGSFDDPGFQTITLGQVQHFIGTGVLQCEEVQDLRAALSFLTHLVALLAGYLDITLPFPCTPGQGVAAVHTEDSRAMGVARTSGSAGSGPRGRELSDGETQDAGRWTAARESPAAASPRVTRTRSRSSDTQGPWWVCPCVLHPFTSRWIYFSVDDGICTCEFEQAMRLLDEDLRQMCASQGEVSPSRFTTLQLLAHLLSAPHLGCTSPPRPASGTSSRSTETPATSSAASCIRDSVVSSRTTACSPAFGNPVRPRAESESLVLSRGLFRHGSPRLTSSSAPTSAQDVTVYEDGEWTVVGHED